MTDPTYAIEVPRRRPARDATLGVGRGACRGPRTDPALYWAGKSRILQSTDSAPSKAAPRQRDYENSGLWHSGPSTTSVHYSSRYTAIVWQDSLRGS